MKFLLLLISTIIFLPGCHRRHALSLPGMHNRKSIALQPFGEYDTVQLELIGSQVGKFFKANVITLKLIGIPYIQPGSYNEKYFADSLLDILSKTNNDSIAEIIGITHKEIFTRQVIMVTQDNEKVPTTEQIGIYGLGDTPGSSCIVSDYKFRSLGKSVANTLVIKAIIHEVGHNLGLKHCPIKTCIMARADGDIANLISLGNDFCKRCRQRISK